MLLIRINTTLLFREKFLSYIFTYARRRNVLFVVKVKRWKGEKVERWKGERVKK